MEASGAPAGVAVGGANRNDFKLLAETIQSIPVARPTPSAAEPQHLCLDSIRSTNPTLHLGGNAG